MVELAVRVDRSAYHRTVGSGMANDNFMTGELTDGTVSRM